METLSTRMHLEPKTAQNTVKISRLKVIQGHAFWKGLSISQCHSAPPIQRTPANIRTNLIFLETRIIDLHFAPDNVGLSSFNFFLVCSVKRFPLECVSAVQDRPRSLILVTIESA